MISTYRYELWNGREVIGHTTFRNKIVGKSLVVPEDSIYKHRYGTKWRSITFPLVMREILNDGINYHYKLCIDVRRKSKRQIEILMRNWL